MRTTPSNKQFVMTLTNDEGVMVIGIFSTARNAEVYLEKVVKNKGIVPYESGESVYGISFLGKTVNLLRFEIDKGLATLKPVWNRYITAKGNIIVDGDETE